MASNLENVRLTVLMKLQEALDEEAILEEQMLALMHRFADRFMDPRVEINNLIVLHDHPLIDYDKYALGCMTGADMKKCVELKGNLDHRARSFFVIVVKSKAIGVITFLLSEMSPVTVTAALLSLELLVTETASSLSPELIKQSVHVRF
uniref:Uncharacterized protein n=1 Tax=Tanacetum cinerariifolium TaxID=118510 RepID=A0A699IB46_TANCI|nr:hypothetical protein [Tanacetum cinerariifolium]